MGRKDEIRLAINAYSDARYRKGIAVGIALAQGKITQEEADMISSITPTSVPEEIEKAHIASCKARGKLMDMGLL